MLYMLLVLVWDPKKHTVFQAAGLCMLKLLVYVCK